MTSSGGVYEFVVAGSFGPVLRSMLGDLDIEDHGAETQLRLRHATAEDLLILLAIVTCGDRELECVLVDEQ